MSQAPRDSTDPEKGQAPRDHTDPNMSQTPRDPTDLDKGQAPREPNMGPLSDPPKSVKGCTKVQTKYGSHGVMLDFNWAFVF